MGNFFARSRTWLAKSAGDVSQRLAGQARGVELGGAGEQAAIAALGDARPQRRWQAAASLGRNSQRSAEAIAGLVQALNDREPFVRWQAAEALAGQEAGRVFPVLLRALTHDAPLVRAGAAEALGRLGGEAACIELRKTLADADAGVRAAAAQSLGHTCDPASLPALLPLLQDGEPSVRSAAANALGQIGNAQAAVPLAEALGQAGQPVLVRRALAAALAKAPHPEVQPTLMAALRDSDAQVRAYAAHALGQAGNEATLPALAALQSDHTALLRGTVGDVAQQALTMLERRGHHSHTVTP